MSSTDFARDRWGRPMVIPEGGGTAVAYSRFSSHGQVLEDRFGLEKWKVRTAGRGLTVRADLLAQLAACPADDTRRQDGLMDQALEAGGGSVGANLGTALHEFAERVDLGAMPIGDIPEPWRHDVAAYRAALDAAGLDVVPELVEVTLVHDGLRLAGTGDRFYRRRADGRLVCADLKTGKAIGPNPLAYAVQLAAYATAVRYDLDAGTRTTVGDVDTEYGLLVHVPAGRAECALHYVNLTAGLEAAHLAATVREWQKRRDIVTTTPPGAPEPATKPKATRTRKPATTPKPPETVVETPVTASTTPTGTDTPADPRDPVTAAIETLAVTFPGSTVLPTPRKRPWVEERVRRIVEHSPEARRLLATRWPAGVPTLKNYTGHTVEELDAIARECDHVDAHYGLPFYTADPDAPTFEPRPIGATTKPAATVDDIRPDEGVRLTPHIIDRLRHRLDGLPAEQTALIATLTREAAAAGHSVNLLTLPSERRYIIAGALIDLAQLDDLELIGAVVRAVVTIGDTETVGARIGRLSATDAAEIGSVAREVHGGSRTISFSDDGTVVVDTRKGDNTNNNSNERQQP
jgi:hypothetical protein